MGSFHILSVFMGVFLHVLLGVLLFLWFGFGFGLFVCCFVCWVFVCVCLFYVNFAVLDKSQCIHGKKNSIKKKKNWFCWSHYQATVSIPQMVAGVPSVQF